MYIPLCDLLAKDITVNCRYATYYAHTNQNRKVRTRTHCMMRYVIHGEYHYMTEHGIVPAVNGDVVYLPQGVVYEYEIKSNRTECLQFEFDIRLAETNEIVSFAEHPLIIHSDKSGKIMLSFQEIYTLQTAKPAGYEFQVTGNIYHLISQFFNILPAPNLSELYKKIEPALQYITDNYFQKIYTSDLASLCFISESQLRRIFHKLYNMSPIEYKNHLQIQVGCDLLKTTTQSISSIAARLGYDNIYSFSNFFKGKTGLSPTEYRIQNCISEK